MQRVSKLPLVFLRVNRSFSEHFRIPEYKLSIQSFFEFFASIFIRTTSFFWARAYTIPNMKTTQYIQKQVLKNIIIIVKVSMNFVIRFAPPFIQPIYSIIQLVIIKSFSTELPFLFLARQHRNHTVIASITVTAEGMLVFSNCHPILVRQKFVLIDSRLQHDRFCP